MKRFLLLAVCALTIGTAHAQTKGIADTGQQALINELIKNLETNPDNPLKVDKKLLLDVANAMPESPLKSKLLGYSVNLGVDENLSMRQIYWDLNTAYASNANLSKLAPLAKTGKSLDMLLNQTDVLANQINSKVANYEPGVFINDPVLLSNLQQLTGSETAAVTMGFGLDLAMAFKHDYAQLKAFKEDYNSYAEMSSQMLYLEVDKRMGKALIDAVVGRTPLNMITPIYRYDFDNGSSIVVDKGILKYVNEDKKIYKDIVPVENRNNGKSYNSMVTGTFFDVKSPPIPQMIHVSPTEKSFILQTGKIEKENKCDSCLPRFEAYTIDTETGSSDKFKYKYLFLYDYLTSTEVTEDSVKAVLWVPGQKVLYHSQVNIKTDKAKSDKFKISKDHFFKISKTKTSQDVYYNAVSSGYRKYQSFVQDDFLISLLWNMEVEADNSKSYSSSLLAIGHTDGKRSNNNTLLNELTGIARNKQNRLYFTTANGNIGSIDLNKVKEVDTELPELIKQAQTPAGFVNYTHQNNTQHLFQASQYSQYYSHPTLTLTPDEKHLIYIVGNNLYIIDVNKLTEPKKFTLTIDPFHLFFAKENGEPTLYLQAFNEFKFPITKKYALNKLITAPKEDKRPIAKSTATTKPQPAKKAATDNSVADEIKKLRALLDDGSITQQEFDQAKKKLLNN